jgi:Holliday junction resolvasome RuvABC endonuclease subunit
MKILALDISTHLGWARYANGVIDHGIFNLSRKPPTKTRLEEHEGNPFLKFSRWMQERLGEDRPELIVYERTGHFASATAANSCLGLRGVMFCRAAHYGTPLIAYSPLAIKKWATGSGLAKKPAMIAAAQKLSGGEGFADDNAADAYLMLKMHLSLNPIPQ